VQTGETLTTGRNAELTLDVPASPQPVLSLAVVVKDRKDEVKLTSAVQKLVEEDPSLSLVQDAELHEIRLAGQGEMHLRVALAKLTNRFGVAVASAKPRVGYRETIRKPTTQRGRHKKQSGGHGQFGDVVVDIAPLPRGSGFVFTETITGGVVPRNYIPAVEAGVRDALAHGPLGFPVVDVAVTLKDGSYHSVDSSDQAFRLAGRLAMNEGLPHCQPVLLEPILKVEIATPSEATAKINAIISGRRGQILGFDSRPGWPGWDQVEAYIPESEIQDLIVEIRSATAGVGSFSARFDHMAELTGRLAEQVAAAAAPAA
jgi:elongation factor G